MVSVNIKAEYTQYTFLSTDGWIKGKMMVKLSENCMPGITVSSLQVSVMYTHFLKNSTNIMMEESMTRLKVIVLSFFYILRAEARM